MAHEWHLKSRPEGLPTIENFELVETPERSLKDGEIRIRNTWLSVDPYMRGRMNDTKSYSQPFALGETMQGGAVGEVIESKADGFAVGDKVQHLGGWREEAVIDLNATGFGAGATKLPDLGIPDQLFLYNMGMTGGTAYFGLLDVASAKEGDIVFVSAAAGAVGSAVVQIAKLKGMTVIGSAGGADKCAWVKEIGADACIDYKSGPVLPQLREAAPNGIDVYFDNVGSDHLDAAFACARYRARFAICGMIDIYNDLKPQCFKHISAIIGQHVRIEGFLYPEYMSEIGRFYKEVGPWVREGKFKSRETVKEGIESMVDAFGGLFTGDNTGKMLVKV